MLEPDELGRVGTTTAQSASKAVDRIIERLAERVSAALIDDMRAALTDSATVPAMVLEILGSNPIARNSDARREYQLNLTKSAKADAVALGAKASLEVFQGEVETATDRLMTQLAEFKQRSNLSMAIDAKNTYQSVVTELLPQVQGGTLGYEEAVQKACKKLSERGVCIINYASGRRDQPDVAVRRHIQTQLRQAATASTLSACERLGVILVEVSSHVGARPTHQEWQGQVYGLSGPVVVDGVKYKGFKESGAYDGLQEPNCRHSVAPYVPGRARRWSATPDKDAGLDPKESYNATQRQRYNERKIRAAKREALACREVGVDDTAARLRLGNAQRAQRQLLNQNKWLARRTERESVSGGQGIRGITTIPAQAKSKKSVTRETRKRAIAAKLPVFDDGNLGRNALSGFSNLPVLSNEYALVCHGSPKTIELYGQVGSAVDLYKVLKGRIDYSYGQAIRLFSCSTGAVSGNGDCIAQELANKLGVAVYAPDKTLYVYPNGHVEIGSKIGKNDGKWVKFIPDGSE